jgi:hypothetical protein
MLKPCFKNVRHGLRTIPEDWEATHDYQPVLFETFVDTSRYKGTCYHVANWIKIGETKGRHVDKHGEKKH